MTKKLSILFACVAYLTLNIGISVNVHYCGNAISFLDFFPTENKSCCDEASASCCRDTLAFISPDIDQNNTSNHVPLSKASSKELLASYAPFFYFIPSSEAALEINQFASLYSDSHRPVPIFIQNCSLLL